MDIDSVSILTFIPLNQNILCCMNIYLHWLISKFRQILNRHKLFKLIRTISYFSKSYIKIMIIIIIKANVGYGVMEMKQLITNAAKYCKKNTRGGKGIYWELCTRLKWYMHKPESVLENEMCKILTCQKQLMLRFPKAYLW